MTEYSVKHIPLITFQTSGDTYCVKTINETTFFCVIDIAGHGTRRCFMNAFKSRKTVENNIGVMDFRSIITELHKILSGEGAVVLIGSINNNTGEYIYSGIGNISVKKITHENKIKILKTQEGIIGLFLPGNIRKIYGKLNNGDYLFIHTDGVKSSINLKRYFVYKKSLDKTLNLIMKNERNIDDALGLLIRYNDEE